ncbi:MAG: branched-chain amino acid ABC transporter permease [Devosia sp.]|jgi:branched-chain amino acid transport system permease protein
MNAQTTFRVERWTAASRTAIAVVIALAVIAAIAPFWLGPGAMDRLTILFVYIILAVMWNALAGYAGLVSVGQQLFVGLGAYFTIKLADWGVNPFVGMVGAAIIVGVIAVPLSFPMLRLRGGEFAIGMWVVSEMAHLLVNLDPLVRGETGTSLISLNAFDAPLRRNLIYWLALAALLVLLGGLFMLLRSRVGAAIQAIRDNEEAAASVGVRVTSTKRMIFIFTAVGVAMAGALWLATALTFQPKAYFSVQWTAYMIFMVLVGGIGTFEGAILGAVIFFAIETWFGATGVWYLVGLGATALIFALLLPRGIWGEIERRTGLRLLPVGYRLEFKLPGAEP